MMIMLKLIQCLVLLEIQLDIIYHNVCSEYHELRILLFLLTNHQVLMLKFFFYVLILIMGLFGP